MTNKSNHFSVTSEYLNFIKFLFVGEPLNILIAIYHKKYIF